MKSRKSFSTITLLAFVSAVALLCAGFIVQTTATPLSDANSFQVAIWQRETQTLVMMGIYFALLAGAALILGITARLWAARSLHTDKISK